MANGRSGSSFISDQRGVSAVLGFILIFGIIILGLASYQVQIVPQQNAATEFEHFGDVRDEMVGIRNSISTAGQADVSQFSDLTLGTNYQTRTFSINPPHRVEQSRLAMLTILQSQMIRIPQMSLLDFSSINQGILK